MINYVVVIGFIMICGIYSEIRDLKNHVNLLEFRVGILEEVKPGDPSEPVLGEEED